jgi:hypothetical protein
MVFLMELLEAYLHICEGYIPEIISNSKIHEQDCGFKIYFPSHTILIISIYVFTYDSSITYISFGRHGCMGKERIKKLHLRYCWYNNKAWTEANCDIVYVGFNMSKKNHK